MLYETNSVVRLENLRFAECKGRKFSPTFAVLFYQDNHDCAKLCFHTMTAEKERLQETTSSKDTIDYERVLSTVEVQKLPTDGGMCSREGTMLRSSCNEEFKTILAANDS